MLSTKLLPNVLPIDLSLTSQIIFILLNKLIFKVEGLATILLMLKK
jgi:hypothetical protein